MSLSNTTLSKYLGVTHNEFVKNGVYDALLGKDSRLHIDPLLIRDTTIPEFEGAYKKFLDYFTNIGKLVPHVESKTINDKFYRRICLNLTFKERANTGLGYGKNNGHGTGISGKLSIQLANSVIDIVNAGIKDPDIFALMPVIEENIASDRISDMMISILIENFVKYTSAKMRYMGITIHTSVFRYGDKCYAMPTFKDKPIIFIPQAFLCDLPEANSWEDIETVDNYNRRIKEKVCKAIGIALQNINSVKKTDIKQILLSRPDITEDVLSYYRSLSGIPYDFSRDKLGEYIKATVEGISFPKDLQNYKTLESISDVRAITNKICDLFKSLIENNRMYKLFWDSKTNKYSETNAQLLFFCIAEAYCDANNIDLTRESDAGFGELDFKLSRGSLEKVLIEMKLSSNSELLKGLKCQLPAYMMAEHGSYGILMILLTKVQDKQKVSRVISQYKNAINGSPSSVKQLIIINAINRNSASKLSNL